MYNNLIVSHDNKPRYVDISRYAIYRYGLTLYRYSDIVLKRYDTRYIVASLVCMKVIIKWTPSVIVNTGVLKLLFTNEVGIQAIKCNEGMMVWYYSIQ